MASRFDPRLVAWFDEGIARGCFKVPSGRHIILNEFPRLMKASRLKASAGVDAEMLRAFLLEINPNIVTLADGSANGLRRQLELEHDPLPALRKAFIPELPGRAHEEWFVYTPPLDVLRRGWNGIRRDLGLPAS